MLGPAMFLGTAGRMQLSCLICTFPFIISGCGRMVNFELVVKNGLQAPMQCLFKNEILSSAKSLGAQLLDASSCWFRIRFLNRCRVASLCTMLLFSSRTFR